MFIQIQQNTNANFSKIEFKEIHPEILKLKAKVNEYVLENSFNLEDFEQ
jgi:hypothetical protein